LWKCLIGKGLCTNQDLHDIITEFRRKTPRASIPETTLPEPYLLTKTENTIIDDILELLNKHGLTSYQSLSLPARLGGIMRWDSACRSGRIVRPTLSRSPRSLTSRQR